MFLKDPFHRDDKTWDLVGKGITLNQNDKILKLSKLKDFAEYNLNVAQIVWFFFDRVENIVKKGENAGY